MDLPFLIIGMGRQLLSAYGGINNNFVLIKIIT
jgi:hypothetical protein